MLHRTGTKRSFLVSAQDALTRFPEARLRGDSLELSADEAEALRVRAEALASRRLVEVRPREEALCGTQG